MSAAEPAKRFERRTRAPGEIRRDRLRRLPFLALGLLFFVGAVYGGLWRLGWPLPHAETLGEVHGPLMICGFFGTLIGLERAVAVGRNWAFGAPFLSCSGALTLLAGAPILAPAILFGLAASVLTAASCVAKGRDRLSSAALAVGAMAWGVGTAFWFASGGAPSAAPWWLLFLALTIVAERLDANPRACGSRLALTALLLSVASLIAGASGGLFDPAGAALLGAGFLGLAIWLLWRDAHARDFAHAPHLRFFSSAMSAAYVWLAVAGLALLAAPPYIAPYGYDLTLHAVLIGFVLSMALGHSVIVIPAITAAAAPYHVAMYAGLGLLQASIALRACSDFIVWNAGRMASGALTVAALSFFGAVLAWRIAWAKRGNT